MCICKSVTILGALVAMTAFAGQSLGAAAPVDDIRSARSELSHGRIAAAFAKTELAETGLLNQKQSGDQNATTALDSVKKAHEDLVGKNRQAAMADLDSALSALGDR